MKRHASLTPLSRDHHHALLLCWKIRQGGKKGVHEDRIRAYCHWFYHEHLLKHFDQEEQVVFPLLPEGHPMVLDALAQHAALHDMFNKHAPVPAPLNEIAQALESHIRFEERVLFPEIQQHAAPDRLTHAGSLIDDAEMPTGWNDEFWL